ncbi:MAG: FliO/MopB family protein [Bacillota bacterium]
MAATEAGTFQYQAPQAPARTSGWVVWGQVFYFLLVFGIVIGLAYLVTRALANRTKIVRQSTHLRVIDELALGVGRSVLLLDCVDRILIVGASEKSLSLMGQIDEPALVAQLRTTNEIDAGPADFSSILQRALRPMDRQSHDEYSPLADAERNAKGLRDLTERFGKQGRIES